MPLVPDLAPHHPQTEITVNNPTGAWLVLADGTQHHYVTWQNGRQLLMDRLHALGSSGCHECGARYDVAHDTLQNLQPGVGFADFINEREFILTREQNH